MAYSKRWFRYVSDDATNNAIFADESSIELVNPAAAASAAVTGLLPLPKGVKIRKISLKSAAGNSKTVAILTRAAYDAIAIGASFTDTAFGEAGTGVIFQVVLKNPEIVRGRPISIDTGMIDGDNP